jgi:MYXO-CTERM domain-containing protein
MSAWARSFARALLLLSAAGATWSCASADADPNVQRVRSAISGGQPDSVDSNVFVLVSHRGSSIALCSASLIAPNLLLTARHCVSSVPSETVTCGQATASAPFSAGSFFAANTESIEQAMASDAFQGASVSVPTQSSDLCGFDLALVTLTSPVPASVAVPLVPRIDRPVQRGELYRAVGYGDVTEDGGTVGERMGRTGLRVGCAPGSACGIGVEASEFLGDTGICSGDSGGPALDSAGKVVGVVSRAGPDCSQPIYGSVASWKDWIIGVAKQAAVLGNYPPPFWVQTGVSDPPLPDAGVPGSAGAPATDTSSFGVQGDKCGAPQDCVSGYGCFSPSGSPSNAYCAELCTAATACASGTHCDSRVGVCVAASTGGSVDSSSCAFRTPGGRSGTGAGALGLAGLAFGLAWRRRRAAR